MLIEKESVEIMDFGDAGEKGHLYEQTGSRYNRSVQVHDKSN